jgi:hypothetical protein
MGVVKQIQLPPGSVLNTSQPTAPERGSYAAISQVIGDASHPLARPVTCLLLAGYQRVVAFGYAVATLF